MATSPAIAELTARLAAALGSGTDTDAGTDAAAAATAAPGAAANAAATASAFWDGPGARTPLIEEIPDAPDERIVTFLWRDADAAEVLLFVNRLTDERDLERSLMRRVPGADVWHLSYRMGADWRASYAFLVRPAGAAAPWTDGQDQVAVRAALDHGRVDPRNPDLGRNRDGVAQSVVSLPAAPAPVWLAPREGVARGAVAERVTPDGRRVWVHTPAGGLPAGAPVVVALDGEVWTGSQDLPTTVDNLVADGEVRAPLLVLPDSGGRAQRWREMDAQGDAASWVAGTLLPWVRAEYDVSSAASDTVVVGQSLGGLTALRLALTRPDVVGAVLSQSASLWQDDLSEAMAGRVLPGLRAYVEVGTQEWVLREPNRLFAARLQDAGADVRLVEYNGGHDYACWRIGVAEGLRHLLGR